MPWIIRSRIPGEAACAVAWLIALVYSTATTLGYHFQMIFLFRTRQLPWNGEGHWQCFRQNVAHSDRLTYFAQDSFARTPQTLAESLEIQLDLRQTSGKRGASCLG